MPIGFVIITLGALLIAVVGWLGLTGKLPRNYWAGIRTPYTMSSDERWDAANRAGGGLLVLGGVAVLAMGLAVTPFAIAGKIPTAFGSVLLLVAAVILGASAMAAWRYGVSRAKALVDGPSA